MERNILCTTSFGALHGVNVEESHDFPVYQGRTNKSSYLNICELDRSGNVLLKHTGNIRPTAFVNIGKIEYGNKREHCNNDGIC